MPAHPRRREWRRGTTPAARKSALVAASRHIARQWPFCWEAISAAQAYRNDARRETPPVRRRPAAASKCGAHRRRQASRRVARRGGEAGEPLKDVAGNRRKGKWPASIARHRRRRRAIVIRQGAPGALEEARLRRIMPYHLAKKERL